MRLVLQSQPVCCTRPNPTKVHHRKAACCALRDNPQNTDTPKVTPQASFSPTESVSAQLEALRNKDIPWYNHGIQVMYEFGEDVGGMDRSRYFGYGKDLYHFDHFMGEFLNKFKDIIDHSGFELEQGEESETLSEVVAKVSMKQGGIASIQFTMKVKDIGRNKGRWMTKTIKRMDA